MWNDCFLSWVALRAGWWRLQLAGQPGVQDWSPCWGLFYDNDQLAVRCPLHIKSVILTSICKTQCKARPQGRWGGGLMACSLQVDPSWHFRWTEGVSWSVCSTCGRLATWSGCFLGMQLNSSLKIKLGRLLLKPVMCFKISQFSHELNFLIRIN